MKTFFYHAVAFAVLCFTCVIGQSSAFAADRTVDPNIFYHPPGSSQPRWDGPGAALAYYQALLSYGSNFQMAPSAGGGSINGKANSYLISYDHTPPGGVLQHGGASFELDYECVKGSKADLTGTYPHYTVVCKFDPQLPQPPCETCPTKGGPSDSIGNPILPSTMTKIETAVDYAGGPSNSLQFVRTYRSDRSGWTHNYAITGVDYTSADKSAASAPGACHVGIGPVTRERICVPYRPRGTANDFSIRRGHGRLLTFGTASDMTPLYPDVTDKVTKVVDGQGKVSGWLGFNAKTNANELYDPNGLVKVITQRDGRTQTFTYSDALTLPAIAPRAGLLLSVMDDFGYQLTFTYDAKGRMKTMTSPDGEVTSYGYDEPSSIVVGGGTPADNLTSVTYPGGKRRIYWYNEQDKTADTDLPAALTGITDENGARFSTYTYNSSGKAISTEHAGGVEKYVVEPWGYTNNYVTDPMGQRNSYNFQTVADVSRMTSVEQKAGAGSPARTITSDFDTNGNVTSTKDANGNVTRFEYDLTRNLEVSRTEAFGKSEARTFQTEWHPTLNIVKRLSEPLLRTTLQLDDKGNVLTRTVQATTDANGSQGFNAALTGRARTWTYTFNTFGQILSETSPRADVVAKTTYTYDGNGNVKTVTNAAGHVTTFNSYDANGRATMITTPSGQVIRTNYLPRGWVQSTSVTDAGSSVVQTTCFTYDDVGQVKSVTMPDQSATYYTYDAAHRLTDVEDKLGNKIHYTLDNMGKRTEEQVSDPSGTLARQISRQFDVLSRLKVQTGGL